MDTAELETWLATAGRQLIGYLPRVLLALLVLWLGLKAIGLVTKGLRRGMAGREVDPTLQRFLSNLVGWGLKILLFISVIQMLGVATTSFVAVIGAAGLAVGLALQGTLANFAGGVLVLLFRPYKVGDIIEAQGHTGEVREIQIFTTVLLTVDHRTAIIPNGAIANGNIVNHTQEGRLRVELPITINDQADVAHVRSVLLDAIKGHPDVLADPPPTVAVTGLTPLGTQLSARPWCESHRFWQVHSDVLERCQSALLRARVPVPAQQIDVRINQQQRAT
jgi:small conductance mechanosensitive channel